MTPIRSLEWIPDQASRLVPGRVRFLDQTRLPAECRYVETRDWRDLAAAIRTLGIRGAPAIGVAAAMGAVLAAQGGPSASGDEVVAAVRHAADALAATRPTAVNLFAALARMRRSAEEHAQEEPGRLLERLAAEMHAIWREDQVMCRAIGEHGVALLQDGQTVLTHCNAGSLATTGIGTALAPIYVAHERGWHIQVLVDETRPLLQGARLTAWELSRAGIAVTLICDNTAAHAMRNGRVQAVLVGADRIARNGDTANKIGTYGLALAARAHAIPFYVCAPSSTFDLSLADGSGIPIEERAAEEITRGFGTPTAPSGIAVYAPAFDVTPAGLITAIVSERGILRPPFDLAAGH